MGLRDEEAAPLAVGEGWAIGLGQLLHDGQQRLWIAVPGLGERKGEVTRRRQLLASLSW